MHGLSEFLDFDSLMEMGIILEHYPLHRLKSYKAIIKSLENYFPKLESKLIFGNWTKYSQPIQLIKKYYGEKFAFYFLFFCTYQSHLMVPAFFGSLLTGY